MVSVESRHLVEIERPCEFVVPSCRWAARAGQGGRVTEVHLHIERQTLEPGRPVAIWPGRRDLYASYDPAQICEARAIAAIRLLAPGMPDISAVIRTGESGEQLSSEDIAKHGRSR